MRTLLVALQAISGSHGESCSPDTPCIYPGHDCAGNDIFNVGRNKTYTMAGVYPTRRSNCMCLPFIFTTIFMQCASHGYMLSKTPTQYDACIQSARPFARLPKHARASFLIKFHRRRGSSADLCSPQKKMDAACSRLPVEKVRQRQGIQP